MEFGYLSDLIAQIPAALREMGANVPALFGP